jgi:hypothetical protein
VLDTNCYGVVIGRGVADGFGDVAGRAVALGVAVGFILGLALGLAEAGGGSLYTVVTITVRSFVSTVPSSVRTLTVKRLLPSANSTSKLKLPVASLCRMYSVLVTNNTT